MPVLISVTEPVLEPPLDDDATLATLVARAIDEARAVASAEVSLVKARVSERLAAYQNAIVFFVVAVVLVLSAVTALLVGLILTLSTLIGPGFATAVVVVVALTIAGVLALIGKGKLAPPRLDRPQ